MVSFYWSNLFRVLAYLAIVLVVCLTTAVIALFCSVVFRKTSISLMTEPSRDEGWAWEDPTEFALPSLRGFSRAAWLTFAPGTYEMADWTETPPWLTLEAERLGRSFSRFVATNIAAPLLMADKAMPRLTVTEAYAKSDSTPANSVLRVEGELAHRPLLEPIPLRAWPSTDILLSTVVQLLVDADGRTLSATLLESSGLKEADDFALRSATAARFQPVPSSKPRPSWSAQLARGQMIFQWRSLAPPDFGNDIDAGETGVASFVRIEGGNADQAMDTPFGFAIAVGIFAGEQHGHALDPGGFTWEHVGNVHLPAAGFGPSLIHPQEHVCPVAGLGATRAGVDAHDAVAAIVRAVEKNLQFEGIEFFEKFREVSFEFLLDFALGSLRLGFAQLDHHLEIFELLFGFEQRLGLAAERIGLVYDFLRLLAIIPEIVRRHQGVDFAQAFLRSRYVKETSASGLTCPRRSSIRL
jgi:hypothetical protein